MERADSGQLLAAWVCAEARRRRRVAERPPVVGRRTDGRETSATPTLEGRPAEPGAPLGVREFALRSVVSEAEVVLEVHGEVDVATAPALEQELLRLASGSDLPVILNLRSTTFFDSHGLHAVIAALGVARDGGSDIVLQEPNLSVRKILDISGATRVLNVLD